MASKKIDVTYVEQLKAGDEEAFATIYDFYKNPLYYFVFSLVRNSADAEDVVQESFIQIIQSLPSLRDNHSFHPWLYRIAYNRAMLVHQKKKPTVEIDTAELFENFNDPKMDMGARVDEKEIVLAIKKEISKMPAKHTQVAQLYYFDELTMREIAEIMGIPEGTVKTRLNKVRTKIKPALLAMGFSPKSYFSLALTPCFIQAFILLVKQNELSQEVSSRMYETIVPSLNIVTTASVGIFGSLSFAAKVSAVLALGTTGSFAAYQTFASQMEDPIEQIAYHQGYTNKHIEVVVEVEEKNQSDVEIKYEEMPVIFQKKENQIMFTAKKNGTYEIRVGKQAEQIVIANIDILYPKLESVEHQDDQLIVHIQDDISGVDYKKSYAEYDGNRLALTNEGVIKGVFETELQVYLYDHAGNMSTYAIDVAEKQE